jgi:hypothetical protein
MGRMRPLLTVQERRREGICAFQVAPDGRGRGESRWGGGACRYRRSRMVKALSNLARSKVAAPSPSLVAGGSGDADAARRTKLS